MNPQYPKKPLDPDQLTKLYYSVGEVADMFGVNRSLIRFWEQSFPSLSPKKSRKGERQFRVRDILEIEKIYHLVKVKGFTLDGARKELRQINQNEKKKEELKSRLIKLKSKIENIRENLPRDPQI